MAARLVLILMNDLVKDGQKQEIPWKASPILGLQICTAPTNTRETG